MERLTTDERLRTLAFKFPLLWLTPSRYRSVRGKVGAALITIGFAMACANIMWALFPTEISDQVHASMSEDWKAIGYWDPLFAGPSFNLLNSVATALLVLGMALFDAATIRTSAVVARRFNYFGVMAPPVGYFVVVWAGRVAWACLFLALLLFLSRPVNAGLMAWLARPNSAGETVFLAVAAALFAVWAWAQRLEQERRLEIYGSPRAALWLGLLPLVMAFGMMAGMVAYMRMRLP